MKRRAVKVVVFLLLGAIVNVVVACAVVIAPPDPYAFGLLPKTSEEYRQALNWWNQHIDAQCNCHDIRRVTSWNIDQIRLDWEYPSYALCDKCVLRLSTGWPFRSFSGELVGSRGRSQHEARFVYYYDGRVDKFVPLPFRPLWPGFAINTIFYAAVLWMLFAFPFVMRRRRRIKRGLCPACAYPVGTSPVCTECGKPVKSRNAETQKAEMA